VPWRKAKKPEAKPFKLLLWTAVAGILFGLLGIGDIAEDLLRATRNNFHVHKASGDIVLVEIDDPSLKKIGRWPWPRHHQAEITDVLSRAGARGIYYDVMFEAATTPEEDEEFAEAVKRSGKVVLGVRTRSGISDGSVVERPPLPLIAENAAGLASLSINYNYQNAAWRLDYATKTGDRAIPSLAAAMADRKGPPGESFLLDYSLDPQTVARFSAAAVIEGKIDPIAFAGKKVIIGTTSDSIEDQTFVPGWGRMGGVYVHIVGAETLKAGNPVNLGWLPALLLAMMVAIVAAFRRSAAVQTALLATAAGAIFFVPALLEARLIFLDVTPALFVLIVVASVFASRRLRKRGLVNTVSGLPNLNALRANREGRAQSLIAARILNYAEIAATLAPEQERQLVDQIVARLRVGAAERVLYQGDGGIFAWFEDSAQPVGNHIDALYALFRNPARVDGLPIDLSISFGVEVGSSRSLSNRLASALVAAEEAAHDGLRWKYHDPETLEDATWKLSMLSQLDSAVDKGEVWVAYQPKLDLETRQIVGAEALARWTHPEKGPIAASEFIAAAEQHDRIGKLTDFVLEQAISAAAAVNRKQDGFGIAVNLSARLLGDKGFVLRLRAMLARNGLPAHLLTLELTETAALAGSGSAFDMLAALRELGVNISIDDYGTGLSTLDYLKKIPAGEIKIDQSFVKGMLDNRSDLVMVQSTIALAHSLERKVVAEGVENQSVLDALTDMKCDVAQGYVIGRPMSLESLMKRLTSSRRSSVA
jgi:EAL domain-containing protein (putative c-di-GMP-specific phosphodiesterase class I)/CHASE2 domain-containing sensor protein